MHFKRQKATKNHQYNILGKVCSYYMHGWQAKIIFIYLDHLALSSINFPSLVLLSSTKRRQICSTFVKYTRTSSLLYWQSRQRKGRSALSLQKSGTKLRLYFTMIGLTEKNIYSYFNNQLTKLKCHISI